MQRQRRRWHHHSDPVALRTALRRGIERAARESIRQRGGFHIVLAGGQTPAALYRELPSLNTDWRRWHIYFSDERCLPVEHPERNDVMARDCWLGQVPIPRHQVATIPAQHGPALGAMHAHRALTRSPAFDLVLLGLGDDGHTASLFAGLPGAYSRASAIPVRAAPKAPAHRVSLSAVRLSSARAVWFLAIGTEKASILRRWQHGAALPAGRIRPPSGVDVFTDNPV